MPADDRLPTGFMYRGRWHGRRSCVDCGRSFLPVVEGGRVVARNVCEPCRAVRRTVARHARRDAAKRDREHAENL